ncbi:MAG TPA: polyamine aminopropyltransferase [Spirochaetota bacterium]|nr:polyamine aminopropyltransferase [Spirochaetota bacterium]
MPVPSQLWFEEKFEIDKGRTLKIGIQHLIEQYDSEFQRIEIYQTKPFGKMLVLDGVIMTTEWDEHSYHEMISHVPMCTHENPETVCVIGGGDGGTIREVLKHSSVKKVDICEIDGDVIRLSQKHLPTLASSFSDSRVTVHTEDGAEFLKNHKNTYDIIIVDSSDPIGPAEVLFSEDFYITMKEALHDTGIAVTQSESFFYHLEIIERLNGYANRHFPVASYYSTIVPTYPSGIIGFTFCSMKYHPIQNHDENRTLPFADSLKYYNPSIHKGAFQLPSFVTKRLKLA